MTCKEKLIQEHPGWTEKILNKVLYSECPDYYDYLPKKDCLCFKPDKIEAASCAKCWDQETKDEPGTYNPVERAYMMCLKYRDTENSDLDIDAVIGYLGEALDEHSDDAVAKKVEKPRPTDSTSIKDSGNRTQFESGAVRDMREGKGRCDLMPLDVVGEAMSDPIIMHISDFQKTQDTKHLYQALERFAIWHYSNEDNPDELMVSVWADMFLNVAIHYEEGAKKYGPDNWRKSIPVWCYIDSAVRHYLKSLRGDKDEPHSSAFVWNIMCCIWEVDYRKTTVEEEK